MQIAAGKFKSVCLRLMDEVERDRAEVIITRRGRPVAKLVPFGDAPADRLFGHLQDCAVVSGDIVAPVGEAWQAEA